MTVQLKGLELDCIIIHAGVYMRDQAEDGRAKGRKT